MREEVAAKASESEQTKPGAKAEAKESAAPKDIGQEIDLFVNQVDALAETLPLATVAIQEVRNTSNRQMWTFLKEECIVDSRKGNATHYRFEGGQYLKFQRLQRRAQKAELAQILVPRGVYWWLS